MLIDGFNEAYTNIVSIYMRVVNYSMSAINFWTILNGELPHLCCIICNTELIVTEFNTVACSVTVSLIFVSILTWFT